MLHPCHVLCSAVHPALLAVTDAPPFSPFAVHGFAHSVHSSGNADHAACQVHQRCSAAAGGGGGEGIAWS